jgi:hypothetical protein
MFFDRNSSAVIAYATTAVGEDRDVDSGANTGHCLVHGVVDEFSNQVVQPRRTGGADVHARSDSDWLETFENGDVARVVGIGSLGLLGHEGILSMKKLRRVSRGRRDIFDCFILPEMV